MEMMLTAAAACLALAALCAAWAAAVFLAAAARLLREPGAPAGNGGGPGRSGPPETGDREDRGGGPEAQMSGAMQAGFENLMRYTAGTARGERSL